MSDVVFSKIKFKNFMSFGNIFTEVLLDQPGTILVVGENLDEGGSSGAGKTTLISAIAYCLYDKIPSKVSKDRLINRTNDTKNTQMEVILHLKKGGLEYVVHRWRGATTGLRILEEITGAPDPTRKLIDYDGRQWHDATPSNTKHFNSKISELVGITYGLFSKIILYFGNDKLFLDESVGTQRAMVEELLRITMLSRKARALKTLIAETEKAHDVQAAIVKQQELQNESRQKRLAEAETRTIRWEVDHEAELLRIEASVAKWVTDHETELAKISEAIIKWYADHEAELKKIEASSVQWVDDHAAELKKIELACSEWVTLHEAELKKIEDELSQLLTIDFDGEELIQKQIELNKADKARFASESADLQKKITKVKADQQKITDELAHLQDAKCPYCMQNFAEAKQKAAQKEADLIELDKELTNAEAALVTMTESDQNVDVAITDLQAKSRYPTIRELTQAKSQLAAVTARFEKAQSDQNPHVALLKKAETDGNPYLALLEKAKVEKNPHHALEEKAKVESNPYVALLEKAKVESNPHFTALEAIQNEGAIKVDQSELEEFMKLIDNQKFLLKLLTDKNSFIRKNIIGKTIPFLNKRIAYYTTELNLPHMVKFQPDMSCEISQYGRVLDHGNLSNGEKKRLNLALSLSFRDVLTYLSSKINVMFTDEIDGGSLDANCVDALIHLLKHKAWDDSVSIFVISHRPEFDGRCDRNMVVRKENGFSSLITQPEE